MSRPTSTPTRSISSNGPIRKPPPSRQMRSICSTVATRSDRSLSDSRPHGRLQRLTRKPGPSAASMTRLPMASPAGPGDGEGALRGLGAGDHLQQRHQRRRVEEVHAHHSLGMLGGGRERGHQQRRRVAGQHAVGGDDLREPGEQLVLELDALGGGLDDDLAAGELLERWAPGAAAPRPRRRPPRSMRPLLTSRSSWPRIRAMPRSSASASGSCRSVCIPATQPSCAIPDPIVPAPATPSTVGAASPGLTTGRVR